MPPSISGRHGADRQRPAGQLASRVLCAPGRPGDHVSERWHRRIAAREGTRLADLYTEDAILESPLVARVLDTEHGLVQGRAELDHFLQDLTRRRPAPDELPSLYRTGAFLFDGETLVWEYPSRTPDGDQLDLVEVMELDGDRIRRHRIYWGRRGTQHVIANAVERRSGRELGVGAWQLAPARRGLRPEVWRGAVVEQEPRRCTTKCRCTTKYGRADAAGHDSADSRPVRTRMAPEPAHPVMPSAKRLARAVLVGPA